jgi:HAD superfamily phosphoserine phosphatase-like hydrolase
MLKPWPAEKLQTLLMDLEKHRPKGRAIAAFDADGTLWDTDLGEGLFHYQIANKLVPLPEDPWGHYIWLKKNVNNRAAYLWLAQICKDVPLMQVRQWADEAVAAKPLPIYDEIPKIVEKLKSLDVEIYVVTASIKWAVEPGARRLGLANDQVIGIETEVAANGLVTDKQKGVISYREGKPEALLLKTGGAHPYFAAGNTEGDKWLLESSSAIRVVMSSAPEDQENWITESKMLALAKERGWYSHRYL